MAYAIDLSARQSDRTLEQALRHHAIVSLTPRLWSEENTIRCRLSRITRQAITGQQDCLVLIPDHDHDADAPASHESPPEVVGGESPNTSYSELVGVYCDAALELGPHRYLFSSDVTAVSPATDDSAVRIHISRPRTLQVAQRRRLARFTPQRSSQVELTWIGNDGARGDGVAWLCNLSADGIACRTEATAVEQLWIGDQVQIRFKLAVEDSDWFSLDAVLCNKTPAGTQGKAILGLQFLTNEGHEASRESADRLRAQLLARFASSVHTS